MIPVRKIRRDWRDRQCRHSYLQMQAVLKQIDNVKLRGLASYRKMIHRWFVLQFKTSRVFNLQENCLRILTPKEDTYAANQRVGCNNPKGNQQEVSRNLLLTTNLRKDMTSLCLHIQGAREIKRAKSEVDHCMTVLGEPFRLYFAEDPAEEEGNIPTTSNSN